METHKRRGRMNWVDWLLLALTASVLFMGGCFVKRRRAEAVATIPITYTLCLEGLPHELAEANGSWERLFPIGSTVSNGNATASMGKVSAIDVREHVTVTVQNGETVTVTVPRVADIYITVTGNARASIGEGLRIGDIRVVAGERGDFYIGSHYAGAALTVFVERGDENA